MSNECQQKATLTCMERMNMGEFTPLENNGRELELNMYKKYLLH